MGIERINPSTQVTPISPSERAQPALPSALPVPATAADWEKKIGPPYIDDVSDEAKTESATRLQKQAECQTCKNRKYKDGSDDPSVSFQTPTKISPQNAARAVAGHEREHVVHEQADAKREGREVVSQSVTIHTSVCPDCGRVYVSGGTTRTSTREKSDAPEPIEQNQEQELSRGE